MKYYLCIDAGTTRIKAGLYDEMGSLKGIEDLSLEISMPKIGYCEMDMVELWQYLCEIIQKLQHSCLEYWEKIVAIGISAQGEGAWLLDEDKKPIRPAILWNDTRSNTIHEELWNEAQLFCQKNNVNPLCAGSYLPILHWMKYNEPTNYNRVAYIMNCKDWINYKLTDHIQTDFTDASTVGFNIFEKKYKEEIFDILDMSLLKKALPKAYPSGQKVSITTKKIQDLLGIPSGTPVVAGALDVATVAVGLGVCLPGQKGSILGTTLGNVVVLNEEQAKAYLYTEGSLLCYIEQSSYLRQVSALSGAVILDWCRKEIADNISFLEMEALAISVPIGAGGVIFLPYLFGERAPFKAPKACASFHGMRFNHSKAHMIRAVYESLAYSLYDCYQYMPESKEGIFIAGGASNSDVLCQMISDMMGERVFRTNQKELGLYGMYKILSNRLLDTVDASQTFSPNLLNHEKYLSQYSKYLDLQTRCVH